MRVYGYSRVSTKEQNLDRQIVELKKYVDERFIFQDKVSGKDFNRPQYQLMRKVAQKGDVIYVKSLDRLGRNKAQIKEELEYDVELINTGVTVASYLKKYLCDNELENNGENKDEKIYLTKPEKEFKEIAKNIMKVDVKINQVDR